MSVPKKSSPASKFLATALIIIGATAPLPTSSVAEGLAGPRWKADIVIALDNSGSMLENDRERLAPRVVAEFARNLDAESRLGLVAFDRSSTVILELSKSGQATLGEQIEKALAQVDYRGQRTNLPAGLERALNELQEHARPDTAQAVILLTDGIVDLGDVSRDHQQAAWLSGPLAEEARRDGVRIFAVAFTEAADYPLLQTLARETGGQHFRALSADDIPGVFGRISDQLVPTPSATVAVVTPSGQSRMGWKLAAAGLLSLLLAALVVRERTTIHQTTPAPLTSLPPALPSPRPAALAELRPVGQGRSRSFAIHGGVVRMGRVPDVNDLVLPWDTISAQHATLEYRDGVFYLRDLRSRNGSSVNGIPFSDPERREIGEVVVRHRDRLRLGGQEFDFLVSGLAEEEETRFLDQLEVGGKFRKLG